MKVAVQESENAIKVLRLLSNLTIKNIIEFLKKNEIASPSQISRSLNISPSTASRCLQELKNYNIVTAKWKTDSVDDRPLKLYKLVPNILRCELVLNREKDNNIKPTHSINFTGSNFSTFETEEGKGVYVSMNSAPFRFTGKTAELISEIVKADHRFETLKNKFEDQEELKTNLKKLISLGLVEVKKE